MKKIEKKIDNEIEEEEPEKIDDIKHLIEIGEEFLDLFKSFTKKTGNKLDDIVFELTAVKDKIEEQNELHEKLDKDINQLLTKVWKKF